MRGMEWRKKWAMQYIERGKNGDPDKIYNEEEWAEKKKFESKVTGCLIIVGLIFFVPLIIFISNSEGSTEFSDTSMPSNAVEVQQRASSLYDEEITHDINSTMKEEEMSEQKRIDEERMLAEPIMPDNQETSDYQEEEIIGNDDYQTLDEYSSGIEEERIVDEEASQKKLSRKERRALKKAQKKAEKERKRKENTDNMN